MSDFEQTVPSHLSLRVAAVQLRPELGNVDANLENSRRLVRQAISGGANWVVLPEFFTTGLTFDDSLLDGHRPLDGDPMQMLKELAAECDGAVGGSYLAETNGHVYNTFVLALADGRVFTHDKDFPSGPIEHAYYAGGEDDVFVSLLNQSGVTVNGDAIPSRIENDKNGVFDASNISVGVALCWEMIRRRTVTRMLGRIDLVMASSAWPTIDPAVGFSGMDYGQITDLNKALLEMLRNAPVHLSKMLGVPVILANLVGPINASKLFDQSTEFVTHFAGDSRIVAADGKTIASRSASDGEGVIVANIHLDRSLADGPPSEHFWIPKLTPVLKELWYNQGSIGRDYYLKTALPYRAKAAST